MMKSEEYQAALLLALELKTGDPVAVCYRSFALAPAPPHGMLQRAATIGTFIGFVQGCIVFRTLDGSTIVDPLDSVYVSSPDHEAFNALRRRHEAQSGGGRISIVGPDGAPK